MIKMNDSYLIIEPIKNKKISFIVVIQMCIVLFTFSDFFFRLLTIKQQFQGLHILLLLCALVYLFFCALLLRWQWFRLDKIIITSNTVILHYCTFLKSKKIEFEKGSHVKSEVLPNYGVLDTSIDYVFMGMGRWRLRFNVKNHVINFAIGASKKETEAINSFLASHVDLDVSIKDVRIF